MKEYSSRPEVKVRVDSYAKEYREKNKEVILEKKKIYYINNRAEKLAKRKAYYKANREKALLSDKKSKKKHIGKVRQTKAKYRKANREKIQLYHVLRKTSGSYTYQEIQELKSYQQNRCFYCEENFDNKYTVDHIVPIKNNGTNNIDNIVLACKGCNCSKQEREVREWIKNKFNVEQATYLVKKLSDYLEAKKPAETKK